MYGPEGCSIETPCAKFASETTPNSGNENNSFSNQIETKNTLTGQWVSRTPINRSDER